MGEHHWTLSWSPSTKRTQPSSSHTTSQNRRQFTLTRACMLQDTGWKQIYTPNRQTNPSIYTQRAVTRHTPSRRSLMAKPSVFAESARKAQIWTRDCRTWACTLNREATRRQPQGRLRSEPSLFLAPRHWLRDQRKTKTWFHWWQRTTQTFLVSSISWRTTRRSWTPTTSSRPSRRDTGLHFAGQRTCGTFWSVRRSLG